MTYQQVRDIVEHMRQAHRQLRRSLKRPERQAEDPRTRALLEELQHEEREIETVLARYGAQGEDKLLNTWLQYVPDEEVQKSLSKMEFTPDMAPDEVVGRKLEFDQALLALLKQLAEGAAVPRVQEFFRTLLEHVESRTARQAWKMREFQPDDLPPPAT